METMKKGSKGDNVKIVQARLKELGFNPGIIDGNFGQATLSALIAFQKSNNMLADGIAGPKTQTALGLVEKPEITDELSKFTIEKVKQMFPSTPVKNIKANLPFVLNGLRSYSLTDKPMALMALATIRAETEGFKPIDEMKSKWNSSPNGHPFDLYDNRKDLGNLGRPDGELFKGRGFIQLTGRNNYLKYGNSIGLGDGLITNPESANDPGIASKLHAVFLKDKEIKIKEALLENDYRAARELVNGGSNGLEKFIESYTTGNGIIA
jgi:putative chitinase